MRGKVQLQLPRKRETCVTLAVHTLSSKDCREEFQQSQLGDAEELYHGDSRGVCREKKAKVVRLVF